MVETQGKTLKEAGEQEKGQKKSKTFRRKEGMRFGDWNVVQGGEGDKDNSRVTQKDNWEIV